MPTGRLAPQQRARRAARRLAADYLRGVLAGIVKVDLDGLAESYELGKPHGDGARALWGTTNPDRLLRDEKLARQQLEDGIAFVAKELVRQANHGRKAGR